MRGPRRVGRVYVLGEGVASPVTEERKGGSDYYPEN